MFFTQSSHWSTATCMSYQPPISFPVLLLVSNWYHRYSFEFLSRFCWWGQFPHQIRFTSSGRTENSTETFLYRDSLWNHRVQPPRKLVATALVYNYRREDHNPEHHHQQLHWPLCSSSVNKVGRSSIWGKTVSHHTGKAMSSVTETAELQPPWQLFFVLQTCSPNKSLLS